MLTEIGRRILDSKPNY